MRLHIFEHVAFEGPGSIAQWAESRGHAVETTRLYEASLLPRLQDVDLLVVMGGLMSVHDEEIHPWLRREKTFLRGAIDARKPVIGICLGSQMIGEVLGAEVYRAKNKEIGWLPVELTEAGAKPEVFRSPPREFVAFHWHGETFDIPDGAAHLARSKGCENQGFVYGHRVLGLQFHLESTPHSVSQLVENRAAEIEPGEFIQEAARLLGKKAPTYRVMNEAMAGILDHLSEGARR